MLAVDLVAVPDQVAWNGVLREGLDPLLPSPPCLRMLGHVEMNHAPAVMSQHHQHKQDSERGGRNGEEVDRDQILYMVVQESLPGLRRGVVRPSHSHHGVSAG